jgi:glycosyltransferase involved in cell wall biosynthesis
MNAKVTVGIPFYKGSNSEHFRSAIDSILSQKLLPTEIHLIQDGPIPNDLDNIVKHYLTTYPFIKHELVPENLGLAHALNLSILKTTTEYYARMDADDIAHPERLKKQVDFLETYPEIDILGTWAIEFEGCPISGKGITRKPPVSQSHIYSMIHYQNPLIHPSVMLRRTVFAKIGLYDTNFRRDQDLELWGRAIRMKVGMTNIPEVLMYYRNTGVLKRRSDLKRVFNMAKIRYRYNTLSPQLNILKILTIIFPLMPIYIQNWGYKKFK